MPRIFDNIEQRLLSALQETLKVAKRADATSHISFYVHRIPYNYVKAFDFIPYFWNEVDGEKKSEDYKPYCLRQNNDERVILAMLNSNLFFWWWYTLFEGYHCTIAVSMKYTLFQLD